MVQRFGIAGFVAALLLLVVLGRAPAGAFTPRPFSPLDEAQNFSKLNERQAIYDTPAYQAKLAQVGVENMTQALAIQAADPAREFSSTLCGSGMNGCAGDIRLYDWQKNGDGIVQPVLFTARNGATISGHVWATRNGPAKRPGVVFSNGSVQADEQLYWFVAQTLAKAGYVVLTYDPQGQGRSDTFGEGADRLEGVPDQSDGRPYIDGTQDAVNFFFSNPSQPYRPIASCNSGASHAGKQNSRVAAGLDTASNPFASMIDPSKVGVVGHSFGAEGVSYIGQMDPRIKAIVALDNLSPPTAAGEQGCVDSTQRRPATITKPALGLSADYFIPPVPNLSQPDPLAKTKESLAYTAAGVDTGQIVIRGGSHFDFDWIPNPAFGATLRGADEIDWYTTAWFDKYLKNDPTADRRLLTARWRADNQEASVDPNHDGNMFSQYYDSRLDVHLSSTGRFDCEDLRAGCTGMSANDGYPGDYSYITIDTTPETTSGPGPQGAADGAVVASGPYACPSRSRAVFHLHASRGHAVVRATISLDGRIVVRMRGRRLRTISLAGLPGRVARRVLISTYTARGKGRRTLRVLGGCAGQTRPVNLSNHGHHKRRAGPQHRAKSRSRP